ncbi:ricin B-like lectin [Panus rudis PR-1116 ss-1]|nr:ricin B-like lectin [Panus rudis PR-1116 ss-1]
MSASIVPGVYFIQNLGSGTVLDLVYGSSQNGTKVEGHAKWELGERWCPVQLWIVAKDKDGSTYVIQNASGGTYMDLKNGSSSKDTPVICYEHSGNSTQKWRIILNSHKTAYVIQNVGTGTYIDLLDGSNKDNTPVNGWTGEGASTTNTHQLWKFIKA